MRQREDRHQHLVRQHRQCPYGNHLYDPAAAGVGPVLVAVHSLALAVRNTHRLEDSNRQDIHMRPVAVDRIPDTREVGMVVVAVEAGVLVWMSR